MSDARPIRTLHGQDAAWALTARPGDPVPQHSGHWVRETRYDVGKGDAWIVITCSCGQTFGGALR